MTRNNQESDQIQGLESPRSSKDSQQANPPARDRQVPKEIHELEITRPRRPIGDVEVITTECWQNPRLYVPVGSKRWSRTYVLEIVNVERRRGAHGVRVTLDEVLRAPKRQLGPNGPLCYVLGRDEIGELVPRDSSPACDEKWYAAQSGETRITGTEAH